MKILAFSASTSSQSINGQLVDYAIRLLDDELLPNVDVEVETINLIDYEMPIYNIDRQNQDGIPQLAQDFYDKIGAADAVIVSFAEHNGFYTAAYKNTFDWASRIDMRVYQEKPVVLFSTSLGPGGGGNVLAAAVASGQFFGYDVKASLAVPNFPENFDPTQGVITNPEIDDQFRAALAALDPTPTNNPVSNETVGISA